MYSGTALVAEAYTFKKQEYNPKSTVICFIAVTVTYYDFSWHYCINY